MLQATWYDVEMSSDRGVGDGDTRAGASPPRSRAAIPSRSRKAGSSSRRRSSSTRPSDFDDFEDLAAEVSYSDTDSLAGRVGARLARSWEAGTAGDPQPAAVWARVNLWHEFLENATTTFSAFGSSVPFTGIARRHLGRDRDRRRHEGANEAWSFYGDLSYQVTFDGEADSFGAEVGVKWRW